ncbi:hypothetical protein ACFE04_002737 [Oxalis oulophora]
MPREPNGLGIHSYGGAVWLTSLSISLPLSVSSCDFESMKILHSLDVFSCLYFIDLDFSVQNQLVDDAPDFYGDRERNNIFSPPGSNFSVFTWSVKLCFLQEVLLNCSSFATTRQNVLIAYLF